MASTQVKTILLAMGVTAFACSLIIFPEISFEASIRGLNMWWEIVFPSLLPFFIVSEMMIGLGVVNFIGVLLEPLMRPLFRVPGAGGFVWAMAMASGFPSGAKLAARLRQNGELSRIEAERLICFTNSSNPLFIFGAVSVGFFYNSHLGLLLAAAHYGGNFLVGLTMRFYGSKSEKKATAPASFSLAAAFSAMHKARSQDRRPIGKLMGDAVLSSIHTLLMIGGFIILFSVLNKILFHVHITSLLAAGAAKLLVFLDLPAGLSMPFIAGLFEITLGSQMVSQVQDVHLMEQVVVVSFILAFSGMSVHAQVASILADTDIRFRQFLFARFLHGIYAAGFAFFLWKPVYEQSFLPQNAPPAVPVFLYEKTIWEKLLLYLQQIGPVFTIAMLIAYLFFYVAARK
ncbi:sporulation integral membrane protein YlbJ [Pseudobacillus badius]|uniref:sporulation integral membrane protein YlbJ n=1 Tax=Bacillus badius TaxID=1455 RepID=UPI000A4E1CB5|nr:sporulation integral membrane protein YlbJ [Bacillus badius]MED0667214.1 sporulation integral membrane protein YlbJ [Bacillus badius]TDW05848.1 sporulation integral membrane protein YlbJ [Bacillus badius]GLY10593.1 sporulation integral membrane protein YlbJ [Bacillus badius]